MPTERYLERMARQKRTEIIANIGKQSSNTGEFLLRSAPYCIETLYPNAWEHFTIVSIILTELANKLNLDPSELSTQGLIHDQGRLLTNYYYQTNLAGEHLSLLIDKNAISHDIVGPLLGLRSFSKPKDGIRIVNNLQDLTLEEIVMDVADNLGRMSKDGKHLIDIEELKEYTGGQVKRYKRENPYPSEELGIKAYTDSESGGKGRGRVAINLLMEEIKYLKQSGINFDEIRKNTENRFFDPQVQLNIIELKNAQETLNPKVDEKFGRKPINTIVFDVGKVLLDVSDEELIENISQKLDVAQDLVTKAFNELNPEAFAGKISNEDYFQKFAEIIGVKKVNSDDFVFPEIYHPMEGMVDIVNGLKRNGVNIWIYSNVISPLTEVARQKLLEYFPGLDPNKILYSCDIRAAKQDKASFVKVAEIVGGKILFVDDLEKYTTNARSSMAMRGFTFRGNPYKNVSPQQRLTNELELAGLI